MRQGFVKVAAATPVLRVADCPYNRDEIIRLIREMAARGAKVMVFPELCVTGYTCEDLFWQDLLLQKAEESLGGAKRMIGAGALDNPRVGEVYGMHIMPSLPLGTIGCRTGAMMAAVDTWEIEIAGRAAHGATPQLDATPSWRWPASLSMLRRRSRGGSARSNRRC